MESRKKLRKKSLFENPRYWYHISTTLDNKREYLKPWDNSKGFNRSPCEPDVHRTCVAPTVEHCLTAVPYCPGEKFVVYRTARKVKAMFAKGVYDANVTLEGWIQIPMLFVKIGTLSLPYVAQEEGIDIVDEAASGNSLRQSGRVLAWWKRRHLGKHIKRT